LQTTIRIHSAYKPYFEKLEYVVDINNYYDLIPYFKAMHPKFAHYIDMIEWGQVEESFSFLDSNYNVISREELLIKGPKKGEKIYLAPAIIGGGGKRGRILLFAAAVIAAPYVAQAFAPAAPAAIPGMAGGQVGSGMYAVGTAPKAGFLSSLGGASGIALRIGGNLALSLVSRLFAKRKTPTAGNTSESPQRDAGMFGSLTNTTSSGTPISLNYGLIRVSGQYLSGYVDSKSHDKDAVIRVGDQF